MRLCPPYEALSPSVRPRGPPASCGDRRWSQRRRSRAASAAVWPDACRSRPDRGSAEMRRHAGGRSPARNSVSDGANAPASHLQKRRARHASRSWCIWRCRKVEETAARPARRVGKGALRRAHRSRASQSWWARFALPTLRNLSLHPHTTRIERRRRRPVGKDMARTPTCLASTSSTVSVSPSRSTADLIDL